MAADCGDDYIEYEAYSLNNRNSLAIFVVLVVATSVCALAPCVGVGLPLFNQRTAQPSWINRARHMNLQERTRRFLLVIGTLPLAITGIFGALEAYHHNTLMGENLVRHTGYAPPDQSKLSVPVMHFPHLDPHKLKVGDKLADQTIRYFCNTSGSWFWQGNEYPLMCTNNAFSETPVVKYVKHRGSDYISFPNRMGISLKLNSSVKFSGHGFSGDKYRFAGARKDPLRIRDAYMHKVWNRLENNTQGLACTNSHIFAKSVYLGIYAMCSDRDETDHQFANSTAKADWIAEIMPTSVEFEASPENSSKPGEKCDDLNPKKIPYPALAECPAFQPFRNQLENTPTAIPNYVNQFIFGEYMRDIDGYAGSTFVHVLDSNLGQVRFGPQWDADDAFQYSFTGYKGWFYRSIVESGKGMLPNKRRHKHRWATQPSKKFADIETKMLSLTSENMTLSTGEIIKDLDELADAVRADMKHDELAWTRANADATRFWTDFTPMFETAGLLKFYKWKDFDHEFNLMKTLLTRRACWMKENIADLKTDSGPKTYAVQTWIWYYIWVTGFIAMLCAAYYLAFLGCIARDEWRTRSSGGGTSNKYNKLADGLHIDFNNNSYKYADN